MTKILVSAAAAIAFGSWSSASANVLTVTDIGTVVGGYDGLGLFGTAGADLIGDSYEAVFTFDLSGLSGDNNDGSQAYAYGGQVFGGSSIFVSEIVTINGVSAPSFGESAGEIYAANAGSASAQSHFAARACPHLSQARAQTKCRPARKLRAVFSQRVAMPRNCLMN